jgi:hypothetical protein
MSSARSRQSRDTHGLTKDTLTNARLESGGHDEVHGGPEDLLEALAKAHVSEQTGNDLKLHEQVDVTFRCGFSTHCRSEEVQ